MGRSIGTIGSRVIGDIFATRSSRSLQSPAAEVEGAALVGAHTGGWLVGHLDAVLRGWGQGKERGSGGGWGGLLRTQEWTFAHSVEH